MLVLRGALVQLKRQVWYNDAVCGMLFGRLTPIIRPPPLVSLFTMEDIFLEIQNESIMADVFCDQDQYRSIKIN